jgi:hypothetical protein
MTEAIRQGKAPKEANLDLDTVRTRRQLEEIRLSMSETASKALEEKGIIIDTENMKEVIKELREIEDSYYKSLLSEAGMEASEDTTSLLKETLVTAAKVAAGPAYVLGRTLETRNIETLESLSVTSEAMREQAAARLEEAYEPLWTAPRSDYGDSIQKAFQNTSELLSELGPDFRLQSDGDYGKLHSRGKGLRCKGERSAVRLKACRYGRADSSRRKPSESDNG